MLRSRATSLAASVALCGTLAFLAATHKIQGVQLFDLGPSNPIDLITKPDPPLPPPPRPDPPEPKPAIEPAVFPVLDGQFTTLPVGPAYEAPPQPPAELFGATWLRRPTAREFDRYYPARASDKEKEGRVLLNCSVNADGTIKCAVEDETPPGWGFGDAAVQISQYFKIAPQTSNGQPTSGGTIRVPITFKLGV